MTTIRLFRVLAFCALLSSAGAAFAQQMDAPPTSEPKTESKIPDIDNGNRIARTLCIACHLIGEPANAPVPSDVPTFAGIANRSGQTADHISTWLARPHSPMPNINLTRTEIRDLTGYILSLRKEQ